MTETQRAVQALLDAGWTRPRIALVCGVTLASVCKWASGAFNARRAHRDRLVELLSDQPPDARVALAQSDPRGRYASSRDMRADLARMVAAGWSRHTIATEVKASDGVVQRWIEGGGVSPRYAVALQSIRDTAPPPDRRKKSTVSGVSRGALVDVRCALGALVGAGMTLAQIARAIGVGVQAVYRWKVGRLAAPQNAEALHLILVCSAREWGGEDDDAP